MFEKVRDTQEEVKMTNKDINKELDLIKNINKDINKTDYKL